MVRTVRERVRTVRESIRQISSSVLVYESLIVGIYFSKPVLVGAGSTCDFKNRDKTSR
jgi:hypothetical protein